LSIQGVEPVLGKAIIVSRNGRSRYLANRAIVVDPKSDAIIPPSGFSNRSPFIESIEPKNTKWLAFDPKICVTGIFDASGLAWATKFSGISYWKLRVRLQSFVEPNHFCFF
jgi:hypothetical protein